MSFIRRASDRKLETADSFVVRYVTAFLNGDRPGMDREVTLAKDQPVAEDWITFEEAMVAGRSGQLQRLRELARRAVDTASRSGDHERAASYEATLAIQEAFFGNAADAERDATAALAMSKGRDVTFAAAFAFARAADLTRAQALATELGQHWPDDTSVQYHYLPTLSAIAALDGGRPDQALASLEAARRYELAMNGLSNTVFCGALYPAYVRGEALRAELKSTEAAAEFQKLIDHPGVTLADPAGVLANLEIGRTWASAGDVSKARAAYERFFAEWKNADPDVPLLKRARIEYAALR
jgi:hypothetical protein